MLNVIAIHHFHLLLHNLMCIINICVERKEGATNYGSNSLT